LTRPFDILEKPNLSVLDLAHLPRLTSDVKSRLFPESHISFREGIAAASSPAGVEARPVQHRNQGPDPLFVAVAAIMGWSIDTADLLGDLA
jgi:hypothetical protein